MLPKHDILKRLHCIEGHLGGIGKMIEVDASCIEVLRHTYAVRKATQKLDAHVVERPVLAVCFHQAMLSGGEEALIAALALFYHPVAEHRLPVIVRGT